MLNQSRWLGYPPQRIAELHFVPKKEGKSIQTSITQPNQSQNPDWVKQTKRSKQKILNRVSKNQNE